MEWIKIKDQLPKIGQEILVWCKEKNGEAVMNVSEPSITMVKFKEIDYSQILDTDHYEAFASGITHWQPLPKAPK